ncbi:type IV pilus secretin PilQ [Proteus hauseri]|uniref:type IV pilus secretin PilQ n=1 Tax=Proteus hauseri TaxID=183417 RepID=UPI0032D9EB80
MKTLFSFFTSLLITYSLVADARDPFFPETTLIEKTEVNKEATKQETQAKERLPRRVYLLNYANAEDLAAQLHSNAIPLLSPKGRAVADIESNSLSIMDDDETLSEIVNWLKMKDIPQQQVDITAYIISSSQDALNELGVQWGLQIPKPISAEGVSTTTAPTSALPSTINNTLSAPSLSSLSVHQNTKNPLHYIALNIARINGRLLELELSALEQEKQLSIIASPRLTAAHEKTASIKQGTEIPYVSRDNEITRVQFKEAVLGMEVTPMIQRNKKIRLILKITQNTPGVALVQGGSEHLSIDKQEISTEVIINDGETLMLGGIFQQKQQEHDARIPFLSSIPLLGTLFSHKRDQHSRHELVIFITPKLI